jgi:hypothetical protein
MMYIWAFVASGVLAIYLAQLVICSLRSSLRNIPGPWLARFTDGWYIWNVRKGSFQNVNIELHKKHGENSVGLVRKFHFR